MGYIQVIVDIDMLQRIQKQVYYRGYRRIKQNIDSLQGIERLKKLDRLQRI